MQCFKLPTSITHKLGQVNRFFFGKKSDTENGFSLVAWDKVCKPKKVSGLGLWKTGAVNTAFLAKLCWKLLTQPDNFWVK